MTNARAASLGVKSGAANANFIVALGGKKYQFVMPGNGWATVKYKP
jgi:hypothetical protein